MPAPLRNILCAPRKALSIYLPMEGSQVPAGCWNVCRAPWTRRASIRSDKVGSFQQKVHQSCLQSKIPLNSKDSKICVSKRDTIAEAPATGKDTWGRGGGRAALLLQAGARERCLQTSLFFWSQPGRQTWACPLVPAERSCSPGSP